jgi:predicted nucleic acid-binding protein
MIVVDASVVVTALADDGPDGDAVRARLRGERLVAPHLIDVEVLSAWRRLAAAGAIDDRRATLAIEDLRSLRVERVSHVELLERCWELRSNLTVYELLDIALLTADTRLATAPGVRCPVEIPGGAR